MHNAQCTMRRRDQCTNKVKVRDEPRAVSDDEREAKVRRRRTDPLRAGRLVLEKLRVAEDAFTEVALPALDEHLRALELARRLLVFLPGHGRNCGAQSKRSAP